MFAAKSRSSELAAAIVAGERALALDPSLPNIREPLAAIYSTLGLTRPRREATGLLSKPFYRGDMEGLGVQVHALERSIWDLPDGGIGFFYLAAARDWPSLNRLFDQRRVAARQPCFQNLEAAKAMVPALRAAHRSLDAAKVLACLTDRLSTEARQRSRDWYSYAGDIEFNRATAATLRGDRAAALHWLERAIDRGWTGLPYSHSLSDRPQLDALRSQPHFGKLQARIDHHCRTAKASCAVIGGVTRISKE